MGANEGAENKSKTAKSLNVFIYFLNAQCYLGYFGRK